MLEELRTIAQREGLPVKRLVDRVVRVGLSPYGPKAAMSVSGTGLLGGKGHVLGLDKALQLAAGSLLVV